MARDLPHTRRLSKAPHVTHVGLRTKPTVLRQFGGTPPEPQQTRAEHHESLGPAQSQTANTDQVHAAMKWTGQSTKSPHHLLDINRIERIIHSFHKSLSKMLKIKSINCVELSITVQCSITVVTPCILNHTLKVLFTSLMSSNIDMSPAYQ